MKNHIIFAGIAGPVLGFFVWAITGMLSLVFGLAVIMVIALILDKRMNTTLSDYTASTGYPDEDIPVIPVNTITRPADGVGSLPGVVVGGIQYGMLMPGWGTIPDEPLPYEQEHGYSSDMTDHSWPGE